MVPPIVTRVCRMTHATNDTVQTAQIFANLADEAWRQLGSRTLADLTLAEIAAHVGVEAGLAVALAGDLQQLILGKMAALDDQAVLESLPISKMLVWCQHVKKSLKPSCTVLKSMRHIGRKYRH